MLERLLPMTLEGGQVRLVPLSMEHLDGLCAAGLDPDLWRWIPVQVLDRQGMQAYVELALDEQGRGVSLPFATTLKATGQVIGCTRYMNIDLKNRRVEIGATWIGRPWHRSVVNTEAKYLMLRHAFETLRCARVELKTDALNERSTSAHAGPSGAWARKKKASCGVMCSLTPVVCAIRCTSVSSTMNGRQ